MIRIPGQLRMMILHVHLRALDYVDALEPSESLEACRKVTRRAAKLHAAAKEADGGWGTVMMRTDAVAVLAYLGLMWFFIFGFTKWPASSANPSWIILGWLSQQLTGCQVEILDALMRNIDHQRFSLTSTWLQRILLYRLDYCQAD